MEFIQQCYAWIMINKEELLGAVVAFWALVEIIVRFTPTKTDDAALERVGKYVRMLLDWLKVPNVEKKIEPSKKDDVSSTK